MHTRFSTQRGFTLLEMVIVLGIVSALMGAFFSFYQPTRTAQNVADTSRKQERIINALANYVLTNNRLPCPARPNENNPSLFGQESTPCSNAQSYSGIVPFRAIGFSPTEVEDGFGHFMTYKIFGTASVPTGCGNHLAPTVCLPAGTADEASPRRSFFCVASPYPIYAIEGRYDGVRQDVGPSTRPFVLALISHGANGFGGYNVKAANAADRLLPIGRDQLDVALGTLERLNAVDRDVPAADRVDNATYSEQTGANHFDDKVRLMDGAHIINWLGVTGCHDKSLI